MNKKVVHSVFDYKAHQSLKKTAIVEKDRTINYSDLKRYSNKIGHCFLQNELKRGEVVGLFLESGIDYVGGILGINKAGGIFMPLDKEYPVYRLEYILKEIRPRFLLTNEANKDTLEKLLERDELLSLVEKIVVVKGENSEIEIHQSAGGKYSIDAQKDYSTSDLELQVDGDDSVYLLYTSGSSGNPKAIEGRHASLAHFIQWEINEFQLNPTVKVSQLAPLLFDVSLRDIFVPLLAGGTLCIPDKTTKADPERLLHWIEQNEITLTHIVPSVFRRLIKEIQNDNTLSFKAKTLEKVLLAGETLYGRDVTAWHQLPVSAELINLYGPSETTLAKIFNRIKGQSFEPNSIVPLGKPIANTIVVIIKNNKLCEVGEIGEIYIKTPFRSKGYYNNKGLTEKAFIQNPLHNDYEDIVYKTGDLGKYLSDRSIEYVGRQDSQVKVRGNRVELFEVEKVILKFEGIDQVVVKPVQNAEGESLLACYYIERASISTSHLKEHLSNYLPEYMHPSFYIALAEFPLSINSKVDKNALPKPEDLLYEKISYEPPRNDLEKQLCSIWSEILGLKKIGIKNSFFELGGHSLRATKVVSRIYKELGKEISLKDFFEHPTITKLSAFLSQNSATPFKPIEPSPEQEFYEISNAQRRLWILDQIEDERIAYNITSAYFMDGNLDKSAFEKALENLIERHESLRTTFVLVGGEPKQKIRSFSELDFKVEYVDLTEEQNLEERLRELSNKEEKIPFDLANGPLLRTKVLKAEETKFVILLTMHHIISDAWSIRIFKNEFLTLYNSFTKGLSNPLLPLRIQYKDFARWQNDLLKDNEEGGSHQEYWLNQFREKVPVLSLVTDYTRPLTKTYNGSNVYTLIDKEIVNKIEELTHSSGTSLFMFLIAVVKTLLYRYTSDTDIVIGSPIAGRNHPDLEDQIGYYVNTLAIRTQFKGDESFEKLLLQVKDNVLGAYEHQVFPFDQLVEKLDIPRDRSKSPLFDVMLVLHNSSQENTSKNGMEEVAVSEVQLQSEVSKYDLTFSFAELSQGVFLRLEYNTDLFTKNRIEKAAQHLKNTIHSIVNSPKTALNQLEILSSEEKKQSLYSEGLNVKFSSNKNLHQLFEEQVARNPENIALSFQGKQITYKQLNNWSNQLACYLRKNYSIQSDDFIGIMMDRSEEMIIVMLAILKSGAAYIALDPEYPAERNRFIIEDSSVKVVITEKEPEAEVDYPTICLSKVKDEVKKFSKDNLPNQNQPTDLAYIIYTSGSTGKPKGVMVEHLNVIQLFFNEKFKFSFNDKDVWTLFHSINFDFSVWEIFGALLFGGKLVVVPKETTKNPPIFAQTLVNEKVTVLNQIPTIFKSLIPEFLAHGSELDLRYVIFGGEALNPASLKEFHKQYPEVKLINMYGITETTIHTTFKEIGNKEIEQGVSNIGQALPTVTLYIFDDYLNIMPENTIGEIVVGGAGLARGYLNQPELTNKKFIVNPHNPGERIYLSGDLGLRLENGEIVYKGRKDYQVKLNGFRIEVGEIESVLLTHEEIEDVVVSIKESKSNVKHLVAYILSDSSLKTSELRKFVSEKIPDYMIPSHFVLLKNFPLTSSGKVDRKSLPDPEDSLFQNEYDFVAPTHPIEELLVSVFEKILGRTGIGITDNFFSLGGDSIKAIQIASKMHNEGYKISVKDVFQNPMIIDLAGNVKRLERIADQQAVTGNIPLTPIQQQFFVLPKYKKTHYNQSVMLYSQNGFDFQAAKAVFSKIQNHHDILRATFVDNGSGVLQVNNDIDFPLSLDRFDFSNEQSAENFYKIIDNIQSSIDINKGPLMKVALLKLPDGDRLFIVIHHLVVDGISWRILFEDIGILFNQYKEGKELILQQKTDSYKLWAERLLEYANSPAFLEEKNYWKTILSHHFNKFSVDTVQYHHNHLKDSRSLSFELSEDETELLLTKVNQAFNTEINDILLTALGLAVHRAFGHENILIALEGHGREEVLKDVDISRTIGWFTSIYPVHLDVTHKENLSRLIMEIKESLRKIPNKGVGYGILKYLTEDNQKNDINFDVAPQISFNYLGQFDTDESRSSFEITQEYKGNNKDALEFREYEFDVSGMIANKKLTISIDYNIHHYEKSVIKELLNEYNSALSEIIEYCSLAEGGSVTPSDLGFKELSIQDLETFFD